MEVLKFLVSKYFTVLLSRKRFIYTNCIRITVIYMPDCHEMKEGQKYMCEHCGFEMKVVNECDVCCEDEEENSCAPCEFVCCGEELTLK